MILTIDIGNTRTKWAVFNHQGISEAQGWALNADLLELPRAWQTCERAIVANVAGVQIATHITKLLGNMPVIWATAEAQMLGLKNNYDLPEKLGIDRWAALLAAFKRQDNLPCLVVNAGTALTIDAIHQSAFIGGLIAPGLNILQQGFVTQTAAVNSAGGQYRDFPHNTADASYSGALIAMAGAVLMQFNQLAAFTGLEPEVLVSGGDAVLLAPLLAKQNIATVSAPQLVLEGLYWIGTAGK